MVQLTQEEIENRYDLGQRLLLIQTIANARKYVREQDMDFLTKCNTLELLGDGLKNAFDGRATGFEWRNLRWVITDEEIQSGAWMSKFGHWDDICQRCGSPLNGNPFSHCPKHLAVRAASQPTKENNDH